MAEKVKEVAIEEAQRVKAVTTAAARSAAYLYPVRVSLSSLHLPPFTDLYQGHILLHYPSLAMETPNDQAHPHADAWTRRDGIYVRLYIHTASRNHGFHKRTPRRNQCWTPSP